jgi:sialic acid synthase SpsE/quercetin dioxygenase-like cupin family protein
MKPLIIFEMANNHMGDPCHGQAVVRAFGAIAREFAGRFEFAFKLQYRDLDTFIHPHFKGRSDVKYVKRFEETRLSDEQFLSLIETMREEGFRVVCTPFDEASVSKIEAHAINAIKIASCSFTDWPLLERIALTNKPIIASTACATLEEIDNVVSFFQHRDKDLTILHCVGEYPTPPEKLAIHQITLLKTRYPDVKIGFSTHEPPSDTDAVKLALAQGAVVLEKHVGLPTERYPLNAYSASPEHIQAWLTSGVRALEMLGPLTRYQPSQVEREGLFSLRRGIFSRRSVEPGETLREEDVVFAFPAAPGQLTANDWSKYTRYSAAEPIAAERPILATQVRATQLRESILAAVEAVKALLKSGNIVVPGRSELELSHHYGMERFSRFGLTLVTVVNREYCKKLLVMLPGQTHPEQYHLQKEETFIILYGEMNLKLDGKSRQVKPGDVITVERGVRHEFFTETGVVFEEISSAHIQNDSFYTDPAITANKERKTWLSHWM